MAQKDLIAVRSVSLSRPNDERFVLIDRNTRDVVDDAHGHGYKTPNAAHASYAFKQKRWARRK